MLQQPPAPYTRQDGSLNDTLCENSPGLKITPPTTPCVTAPPPATNPQNLRTLNPPTWSKNPYSYSYLGKHIKSQVVQNYLDVEKKAPKIEDLLQEFIGFCYLCRFLGKGSGMCEPYDLYGSFV